MTPTKAQLQNHNITGETYLTYIPDNQSIDEKEVYLSTNEFVDLMRKYKNNPNSIQFLADMLEL